MIGNWFDAAGHPDPAAARQAGYIGAIVYVGTPNSAKDCPPSYYQQLVAAGLQVLAVVEHNQHDAELGAAVGAQYARDGLADMAAKGFAATVPLGVTADEHLTAGLIPTAVQFQQGAAQVVRSAGKQCVGYGFVEFIRAIRAAGAVDIQWQCGSWSNVDSGVHLWQDNTTTSSIGGVPVDIDRQLKEITVTAPIPSNRYPGSTQVTWTTDQYIVGLDTNVQSMVKMSDRATADRRPDADNLLGHSWSARAAAEQAVQMLATLQAAVSTLAGAVSAEQAAVLAAVQAQPTGAQVDVQALAAALAPLLGPEDARALVAELHTITGAATPPPAPIANSNSEG